MIDRPYDSGQRAALDVTRINTLAPTYVTEPDAQDGRHPLRRAEATKEGKHRAQCKAAGYDYYTLLLSTFGGIDGTFYSEVMLPHLREELAAARARHEDTWKVRRQHDRWLDRFSIIVARYNAIMIREARWRSGPDEHPPTPLRDDDLEDIDVDSMSSVSEAA